MRFVWLLLVGALVQTPDIHFVPTPSAVVDAMLNLAHVTDDDVIYDLGSVDDSVNSTLFP